VKVWPAKRIKGRIAAKNAVKIKGALATTVNPRQVVQAYLDSNPLISDNATMDNVYARSWAMVHIQPKTEALKKAVERTIVEGWVTGEKAANSMIRSEIIKKGLTVQEIVDNPSVDVWAGWEPGDEISAALLERKYGLDVLLTQSNKTIKDITRTQLDEIGTQLATGLREGLTIDEMASAVRGVVNNPAKALSIAMTEVSRATNYGAQNRYREANIQKNQWSGIDPCNVCAENDGVIVGVGEVFPSNNTQPPAHPNCLCTLLPVIEAGTVEDLTSEVAQQANEAFTFARDREEKLTEEMIAIGRVTGGALKDLSSRLKQPKSIARKIGKMVKDGEYATIQEAKEALADLNRYTLQFEDKVYVNGVKKTIDELTERGYGLRIKNYWDRADYKGINIATKDASGKEFELQLHSVGSYKIKEELHVLYEKYRASTNDRVRWETWSRMVRIASKIPIKDLGDIEELKKIGVLKYEYFRDSKGNIRGALGNAFINDKKLKK